MYANFEDSPEQIHILHQLKDMFAATPHWRLRQICLANNWHLDSCVEQLASFDSSESQKRKSQNSNRNMLGKNKFSKEEERIGSMIRKGYRVLIIMRGPPGVGKTYLSHSLVNNFVDLENNHYRAEDFICSSDDYFYNNKGEYKYNAAFISDAHEFNQRRVQEKTTSGFSPIIVDNTNMQLWEMLPYVKFAVQNNYLIEILEPKTSWSDSPGVLAQANKHGVTKKRIKYIMAKYEKGSIDTLIKMLKNTKYTLTLPQMRLQPPLNSTASSSSPKDKFTNSIPKNEILENNQSHTGNPVATTTPKEQRIRFKSQRSPPLEEDNYSASSTRDVYSLLERKTTNVWKTYETEAADFWGIKPSNSHDQNVGNSGQKISGEKSLLDLLREDSCNTDNELQTVSEEDKDKTPSAFERHSINCPNEDPKFVTLRQIYPNKRVSGLWDLFVKCKGDIDWAVDILLKEDELSSLRYDTDNIYQSEEQEFVECLCNTLNREPLISSPDMRARNYNDSTEETINPLLQPVNAKPQRQRSRFARCNQLTNPALMEVKENIENCFVLGDDLYSQHLLKIRNIRSGTKDASVSYNVALDGDEIMGNQLVKDEEIEENVQSDRCCDDDEVIEEDNESDVSQEGMLEILLGQHLVQQLVETFRSESSLEDQISSSLPVDFKVFMPRSLAKQLYMLWLESAFNHMEEQRLKLVKEDEDFARLLKNPKYSEFKQSPNNLQELLDMEYALKIYNLDKKEEQLREADMPTDLASHLTKMKLCETFPNIPRETLLDILATNDNDYNKTIAVLESTMQTDDVTLTQDILMECARREEDLVNQEVQTQIEQRQERIYNNWDEYESKNNLPPDEVKRLALREFEESRNLAAHHCQLKAECYQKAKEAIQSGNGGAAIYYSQIANLHIKKIDMYNHRAANCIMDVHKSTQNNPDLLDLHYLYLIEALGCLDLFLDRHITGLRQASRNYKHVFIITGRGKHSAGGVSTIKNKVKARLKERCLRWSEVNPGLLKVKIFSGSRHSKNI